jgi:hypothetical protein
MQRQHVVSEPEDPRPWRPLSRLHGTWRSAVQEEGWLWCDAASSPFQEGDGVIPFRADSGAMPLKPRGPVVVVMDSMRGGNNNVSCRSLAVRCR